VSFARRRPEGRGSVYFDFDLPPAPMLKATHIGARRSGKTALMWHRLQQESAAAGRAIECVRCFLPHVLPPTFGACVCGSYAFGIPTAAELEARRAG
jgi:hypothetical protein